MIRVLLLAVLIWGVAIVVAIGSLVAAGPDEVWCSQQSAHVRAMFDECEGVKPDRGWLRDPAYRPQAR